MFFGKCFRVSGADGENNGEKPVVVVVVMPMSEGKFTLAWDVVKELSEFGSSAMVSGQHAIFG